MIDDASLACARLASWESLLRSVDLRRAENGLYVARGEAGPFPHTFGGLLVAQGLVAATAASQGRVPSSLHARFISGGVPTEEAVVSVRELRVGRATSTQEVKVSQGDRIVLAMTGSFGTSADTASILGDAAVVGDPESLPTLQEWADRAPQSLREHAAVWIDSPPPLEIRMGEPPVFLGGAQRSGPRAHWIRSPESGGVGPALQAALLAHASDYLLLDMGFRSHNVAFERLTGTSLDHAVWFHRPTVLDRWHRYTQETVAAIGDRVLVRGSIHDHQGRLVASTHQEVLVRVVPPVEAPT